MKFSASTKHISLLIISLIIISGCARNIQINPDLANIRSLETNTVSEKTVAYYISEEDLTREVITPGGGGDKVKYKPYADTRGALNAALLKKFSKVYSIDSLDNKAFIIEKNISYIFVPHLATNSSSSSLFTWPPTEFTIKLECNALDKNGSTAWNTTINSIGNATFSEFKKDFSLAGRRASEYAFKSLLKELDQSEIFNK